MKYALIGIGVIIVVGVVVMVVKHHGNKTVIDSSSQPNIDTSGGVADGTATGRNMGKIQRMGLISMADKPKVK